jgi:hypothetical protein
MDTINDPKQIDPKEYVKARDRDDMTVGEQHDGSPMGENPPGSNDTAVMVKCTTFWITCWVQ